MSDQEHEQAQAPDEGIAAPISMEPARGKRWYVVHTFTGHENKVKASIERRAVAHGLGDKLGRILVLTEEELRGTRRGKRQVRKHKLFPGYVIIEMELDDQTQHLVRSTAGVTGFIGPGRQPVALERQEIDSILATLGGEEAPRMRVAFERGDMMRVISGPFENFHGRIEDINVAKEKLTLLISIFGRDTPVEVDFADVEKLQ
ncbi:MAG TPA: transcription termination/antitermination protein NusG [Armatimonadota bacterium]|nr:transcription termination/antitermination protein NusG [Armatimonadota bacterium]